MFKAIKIILIFFAVCLFLGAATAEEGQAAYYARGILQSENVLSGADITNINNFVVVADIPASTSVSVSFSQDRSLYYSASGTKGAWTACANGTTTIDLTPLGWSGALLFYKLKLETTDASTTPVVKEIHVNYDGGEVPTATTTRYYGWGVVLSNNMLAGATVSSINAFLATTSLPDGSAARVCFSQNKSDFYSASGTKGAWTELSDGANTIDLSALGWSGASFYYKIRLEAWPDPAVQPKLKEVKVVYEGSSAPPVPSSNYNWTGSFVSADLLASTSEPLTGYEWFAYEISYLPYGATVKAQFSTDGTHWYSSSGQLWGWDTLSAGNHLSPPNAIDLSSLGWGGQTSFYYKIKFTSGYDNLYSPVLKRAGFTTYSAYMSGGAKGAGPVGYWNFDEGQGEIIHDASGRGYAGSLSAGSGGSNTEASQIWTPAGRFGAALEFDGVDDYASVGNINATGTSFALWLKADNLNRGVIDFDGGAHTITLDNGIVRVNGFTSPLIYIDGAEGEKVDNDWHYIVIIDGVGFPVSNLEIGRASSTYFAGKIDAVKIWDYILTADNIKVELNNAKAISFGAISTAADGQSLNFSQARAYCVPGNTSYCAPPVLELKFDEKQGSTAYDSSGYGNDGVFVSSASSPAWRGSYQCHFGNCLEFDGNNDYISVGNVYNSVKTISFWLKTESANEKIMALNASSSIAVVASKITLTDFPSATIYVDSLVSSSTDTDWHYVAIVAPAGIDADAVEIGRVGSDYFSGRLDQIVFYDYARTAAQIAWEYNRGQPVGWWRFNECSGTTVYDESGQGHHGTLIIGSGGTQTGVGSCSVASSTSAWYNGTSGKFQSGLSLDGTDDYVNIGDTGLEVKTFSIWLKPSDLSGGIIDFDGGTHTIILDNGRLKANGFSSATIFVNGLVGDSVSNNTWNHILVIISNGVSAEAVTIGRVGSNYFSGQVDEARLYHYVLTQKQIEMDYNGGAAARF
jgi:hypothetical protein